MGSRGRHGGVGALASLIMLLRVFSVRKPQEEGGALRNTFKVMHKEVECVEGRGSEDSQTGRGQRGRGSRCSPRRGQTKGLEEEGEVRAPNPSGAGQVGEPGLPVWVSEVSGAISGNCLHGAARQGQMAAS